MASIQESLYSALAADTALAALVGDRIYPGQIPDDETPPPWLYYAVPEATPFDDLDQVVEAQHQVEFHALANTYADARAIIEAVYSVLDTYTGGQIGRAFWAGTSEETTEDGYHHVARFTLWATGVTIVGGSGPRARILTGLDVITLQVGGHTLTLDSTGALLLDGASVGGIDLSGLTPGRVVYYDGSGLASAGRLNYAAAGPLLTVTAGAATDVPVVARAAPGQTAALVECQDSTGTALARVSAGYGLHVRARSGADVSWAGLAAVVSPTYTEPAWYFGRVGSESNGMAIRSNGICQFGGGVVANDSGDFLLGGGANPFGIRRGLAHRLYLSASDLVGGDRYVFDAFNQTTATVAYAAQTSTTPGTLHSATVRAWADATHATRKAVWREQVADAGGLRTVVEGGTDGTQPLAGFLGATAVARPTVTGSRGGVAAVAALLTALAALGLITDATTP